MLCEVSFQQLKVLDVSSTSRRIAGKNSRVWNVYQVSLPGESTRWVSLANMRSLHFSVEWFHHWHLFPSNTLSQHLESLKMEWMQHWSRFWTTWSLPTCIGRSRRNGRIQPPRFKLLIFNLRNAKNFNIIADIRILSGTCTTVCLRIWIERTTRWSLAPQRTEFSTNDSSYVLEVHGRYVCMY